MSPPVLPRTFEELLATLTAAGEMEPGELRPEDNLFELGIDSVTLNRVIGQWRTAGVDAPLEDFLENPTPEHWWSILGLANRGTVTSDRAS